MRPVSDEFLRSLRGSHPYAARAQVLSTWQTGVNPAGGIEIPIDDGDIRFDATADIRATLDLTTSAEYWPDNHTDPLNPYGAELFIERGLYLAGGQRVLVSQGYYRIESVEQDDAPDGPVRITAKDRMAGLIDARLEAPASFPASTTVESVFDQLVLDVYPDAQIEFDIDAAAITFPGNHVAEEDRHEFLRDIVTSLGKVWFWDYRGVLVIRDAPDPTEPLWEVTHGKDGVLVKLSRERNRAGVYNAVVVTGETPGGPVVRAIARDISPTSPTYYYGPFGKVPRYFSSPLITTQLGAATAGDKILRRTIGLPYVIDFASVVNPALEVFDPVLVSYSDKRPPQIHVTDKLSMPLTPEGAMTGNTRDQSTVEIEVDG